MIKNMRPGFERKLAERAARFVFKKEGKCIANLSLAIVDSEKMRTLNKEYRNKDRSTDVLTFPGLDILICPEVVKENAKKMAIDYRQEFIRVAVHGALHFLGFDHEGIAKEAKEMRDKEERYLKEAQGYLNV